MTPERKLDEVYRLLQDIMRTPEPERAKQYDKGWDEGRLDLASSLLALMGRPQG